MAIPCGKDKFRSLFFSVILCLVSVAVGNTDPGDFAVLDAFRKGLDNPELLNWPDAGDEDPCGSRWPHVFCSGNRVSQIQVANLGLKGPLPQSFNQLSVLYNVGLQRNNFSGKLPSFRGLSQLQFAYLGSNQFDAIPSDFFVGLDNLQVLSLDNNPLNQSSGWILPRDLAGSSQLFNLSLSRCNLVGELPDFLGEMSSLTNLKLSYNNLTGEIPASFSNLGLQILWLNNQGGPKLTGPIDVLASMGSLTDVWLHGNKFTGRIPPAITSSAALRRLWVNDNLLVGPLPESFAAMANLQSLQVDNNRLVGPIPKLPIEEFSYSHNSFCQAAPGLSCSAQVNALLGVLGGLNYPPDLSASWSGDDPCSGSWLGVSCLENKVSVINLQNRGLHGYISPSIAQLVSLTDVRLGGNNLSGSIPSNLTRLASLKTLNLTANNLGPPVPKFSGSVRVLIDGNPLLDGSPSPSPGGGSPSPPGTASSSAGGQTPQDREGGRSGPDSSPSPGDDSRVVKMIMVVAPVVVVILAAALAAFFVLRRQRKKKNRRNQVAAGSVVVHPTDPSGQGKAIKIAAVYEDDIKSPAGGEALGTTGSGGGEVRMLKSGNLVISVQALRRVTCDFAPENELGRGGFGVVYKGVFHDGSAIAVKRMEAAVISSKALDEFQSEISVLSKVRHRNLVSLLGYSVEGSERLLVYEYMPQGALSRHLFEGKKLGLEPLSWKRRLNVALDVARGMEYLHSLAHQSFIHRDLKSSNILLDDDFRAKVSDFGLVKLAPDGKNSVVTRLAGTFGYLAPEYAVAGRVTTKADVFSFGVVLMELVTGLAALDESRPEENQYLASWFFGIKSSQEKLRAAVDPSIDLTKDIFESISIVAELAGHCAARDPHQRPDMGHAVNVLVPLVERWKPVKDDQEECLGIDLSQPLLQMVKGWQDADVSAVSSVGLDDSKGSIPARPAGFAESFTSADGR
ncbi:unnamed protein product [Spirodela intermedia]|uniref:non-specific serine/threonine protein kinase n=1 Tax=Spirodela intermedia TaxID=51605 RepID=A0A7I8KGE1_SPIIN|nr:unnamed protein product [Spirodela intermedia]